MKPIIEEKIADGKVKEIVIRHTVNNDMTEKHLLMEMRLKVQDYGSSQAESDS
jgi:hypothetical protein